MEKCNTEVPKHWFTPGFVVVKSDMQLNISCKCLHEISGLQGSYSGFRRLLLTGTCKQGTRLHEETIHRVIKNLKKKLMATLRTKQVLFKDKFTHFYCVSVIIFLRSLVTELGGLSSGTVSGSILWSLKRCFQWCVAGLRIWLQQMCTLVANCWN